MIIKVVLPKQLGERLANEMNETLKRKIADQFRNTPLGFSRIKRNLGMTRSSDVEIERILRKVILSTPLENVETKGKNHYFKCFEYNAVLTINSHTLTIITAKRIMKNGPVSEGKVNESADKS